MNNNIYQINLENTFYYNLFNNIFFINPIRKKIIHNNIDLKEEMPEVIMYYVNGHLNIQKNYRNSFEKNILQYEKNLKNNYEYQKYGDFYLLKNILKYKRLEQFYNILNGLNEKIIVIKQVIKLINPTPWEDRFQDSFVVYKYTEETYKLLMKNHKNHIDFHKQKNGYRLVSDIPNEKRIEISENMYSNFLFTNIIRKDSGICQFGNDKKDLSFFLNIDC